MADINAVLSKPLEKNVLLEKIKLIFTDEKKAISDKKLPPQKSAFVLFSSVKSTQFQIKKIFRVRTVYFEHT